jgi:D-arabinose 5-phosphate isomerase GutQ
MSDGMQNTPIGSVMRDIDSAVKNLLSLKKMKICIVCNPGMGGSGIVGTSVASNLSTRGHTVHLVSYKKPFLLNNKKSMLITYQ